MVSYPIEFEFDQDSVVVMRPLPKVVDLDVSSGGWNLFRRTLWFSVEPLNIDLENPTDIRYLTRSTLLPIVADQLVGLDVNYMLTDTLFIHIEKKISREVHIRVDSANLSLDNNYRIVSPIIIDPPVINLLGPETIINSLQEDYYVLIRDTRINDDLNTNLDIPLPYEDIMASYPNEVNVSFSVDRFDRKRIAIPLELLNFPEDSIQIDSMVLVNYTIQRSYATDYELHDFGITLDYQMMSADSTIEPLMIYYPEHTLEVVVTPSSISLKNEGN